MALTFAFRVAPCIALTLLVCSSLFYSAQSLDLESAKESPCFEITKTVPLDMSWVMSEKNWYYPLMSRLDLYMAGVDLSGKSAEELQEDELYYDSCIEFQMSGGKFMTSSFDGKQSSFGMKPIKGMEIYEFSTPTGGGGTAYTTLTDNKTFVFNAICMNDNQMTWGVVSKEKTLPKKTVKMIYDHAESLGFKREHFTGFRYANCKKQNAKNEL